MFTSTSWSMVDRFRVRLCSAFGCSADSFIPSLSLILLLHIISFHLFPFPSSFSPRLPPSAVTGLLQPWNPRFGLSPVFPRIAPAFSPPPVFTASCLPTFTWKNERLITARMNSFIN
eukprot:GHVU01187052.1.p1 GENE.GHVU01187052.1~~GHVU01187052.1.p1  ORF type:complete len:117 (+),score=6.13 GHVU01187052.1:264-614(+)